MGGLKQKASVIAQQETPIVPPGGGILGIDTATPITAAVAAKFAGAGVHYVGRYLVPQTGGTKWKALTAAEAQRIRAAGAAILLCWEIEAERVKKGAETGAEDAARAQKLAKEMGVPAGTAIYFAADYDAAIADYNAIEAYLRGARRNIEQYSVGLYGKYALVEEMAKRNACTHFWQCCAWSYGKLSAHANVYQYEWSGGTDALKMADKLGVSVDLNVSADLTKAGLWMPKSSEKPTSGSDSTASAPVTTAPAAAGFTPEEYAKFKEMWYQFRAELQDNDASAYSEAARAWAISTGLVNGGGKLPDGSLNYMWEDLPTREQLVTLFYRFAQAIGKA